MHRPPNAIVNLKLRLEERLRRQLEAAARKNDRSMNAEIIHRLEGSFRDPELATRLTDAVTTKVTQSFEALINQAITRGKIRPLPAVATRKVRP